MATPVKGYYLAGKKVPSVTTIIGRFKDSSALMHWAFQQGQSGADSLYTKRDEAASIGTMAHNMIEHHINGTDYVVDATIPDDHHQSALKAFEMYLKWESQTKITFLSKFQEISLIDAKYAFGGTPDAIGSIDGEIVLLDWKTSNGIYPDYLIQLAAYQYLVNSGVRMTDNKPLPFRVGTGAHLLRFSKESPDFAHHYYDELSEAWEQFTLYRRAYEIDKVLKKRA